MAYSMPQQINGQNYMLQQPAGKAAINQHNYMLQQRAIKASGMWQPRGALDGLTQVVQRNVYSPYPRRPLRPTAANSINYGKQ